ncbi:MAG: DNA gyrase subunit A [Candidatus Taylorbacteria bacterium RIFCSPHIGHO2_02_FULL_45_28]|uniref:DNA gyrase subunit A n=1 Tax=Candidatus Taylorbacteria bacterium RIFCSPHIGHO2_12_FULL_45_16 TaxID=1802315 RepID=A0A1G2N1K4_9BACT|nr:MAG: DNA gyrase subunit A [Candidatus Taylorbacteria bacterium RIFCSPHIGHO2_01_FULL_44_110]OHA25423.1 MAG: DNA gyrase subunit A [Candidatus Taylorbacteria bacterium RIFCSPHIGHO2_02_FULL_45_28]OHA29091.1 MAG: DNA gyrase subunit A [Candidatus Taylorbacteria bacterium RIFCSPHIGHO2_12_FULL_45_16]OHA33313.1 MAG: DNA gyrase subunit A [Candidatus Taylorbacteria bacterium RIFCSPLOWO2_01_FULL_45_59]OHA44454.1 MAG: DNA gyrase subunit A [Candidatus Taylorbacteria bacterium RIFCSPLOWO2_12_FULL_44_9]
MAKKQDKISAELEPTARGAGAGVVARNITTEMRESFLDYAMSVITDRALPDVRDGLKPVHRRILYAMHEKGLTFSAKFRKSAVVVGDVLGNYHPHGDVAVYDSMVKMAQDFTMRYPLIQGQGNFGTVDGDSAAAMRYTEAKMARVSAELLRDMDKKTVDFRPNYDGTRQEPTVLPTAVPNLLLNGTLGIAVGMATNIAPHNLREVIDATIHLVDNSDATTEDLFAFIKGPDFPTGAVIYGEKDIHHAYATGRGGVTVRGEAEIVEDKKGQYQIVISSIPYRVNKSELIIKMADLVREKVVEGVKGLRDESDKEMRIVLDLKNGAYPEKILNLLYKHTQLEEAFHMNMVALVHGVPQTLSIKSFLEEFVEHRIEVIRRRTKFDLDAAEAREHILLGLRKALDHIDEIIKLIRASTDVADAHAGLMKQFKFSDKQATAILEMRLQKLAGLERKKVLDELKEVQTLIEELRSILGSEKKVRTIIKTELGQIKEKYGDDRRTKIIKHGVKEFNPEDLIADEESVLVLTKGGYVKRTNPDEYRKQKRGGVGVVDLDTKEEDFISHLVFASTHNDLLFFSDKGKAYQIKMYDIPEGKRATKGKSLMNFLSLAEGEHVTSILPMPKNKKEAEGLSLMMVTKGGTGKKCSATHFKDVRRSGLIAITLDVGDELISASFVSKNDTITIATKEGQSIRFAEDDVREMGRNAAGVRVIKLGSASPSRNASEERGKASADKKGDHVISADVVSKDAKNPALFVMGANGYGKKTKLDEYKVQNRGGSGILTMNVTAKTGPLIAAKVVTDDEEEVVAMSKKSQVIRVDLKEIPTLSRATQGVRVMKLREGDNLASLICL